MTLIMPVHFRVLLSHETPLKRLFFGESEFGFLFASKVPGWGATLRRLRVRTEVGVEITAPPPPFSTAGVLADALEDDAGGSPVHTGSGRSIFARVRCDAPRTRARLRPPFWAFCLEAVVWSCAFLALARSVSSFSSSTFRASRALATLFADMRSCSRRFLASPAALARTADV